MAKPELPADVISWFREVFAACNARITRKVSLVPNPMKTHACLSATIFCTLLISLGCNYQVRAEAESAVSQKREITIEEAIKIARTAVRKEQGGKDVKITSALLRDQNWRVRVVSLPATPGGYSTVVISETGDLVRIEPGQ